MALEDVYARNLEHRTNRAGWLRAAVLGANDGLVSTASLMIGVAAAQASGAWLIAVPHLVTVLESARVRSIRSLEQLSFSKLEELFVDFSAAI